MRTKYTTLSRERQMKMCRLKVPGWHYPAVPNCNYGHSFALYFQKAVAFFLMQRESKTNVDLLTRVWLVCPEIVNGQGCNLKNAFVIPSISFNSEWEPTKQSQKYITTLNFSRSILNLVFGVDLLQRTLTDITLITKNNAFPLMYLNIKIIYCLLFLCMLSFKTPPIKE